MTIKVNRPEGTVDLCIDLALRGEWEDAVEILERVRQKPENERQLTEVADAAHAVQDLEARMRASTLRFRLRALPRKRWQELGEEHQPRDGNTVDQTMGIDTSKFFDAVIKEPGALFGVNNVATGEVVDFDAAAEWDALADEMTDGQYKDFADEVLRLNRGVVKPPFSRDASLLTRDSDETSSSPKTSGSASNGSTAGPPSPGTSTTTPAA